MVHPEILDGPGDFGGCHGAQTLALYAQYPIRGTAFVRSFFEALVGRGQPAPVEPTDLGMTEEEYTELVLGLVPTPAPLRQEIVEYCYPTGDAGVGVPGDDGGLPEGGAD